MIVVDCKQGEQEWFQARLSVASASRFKEIITPAKGEYSKSADKYMRELIGERITGKKHKGFSNKVMDYGIETEAEARSWYAYTQGVELQQVGFIYKDERKLVGCSPDSIMPELPKPKGLEVKCVIPTTMVEIQENNVLPIEYIPQIQGGMYITGYEEWDLLIFNPDFPKQFLITVKRDQEYISRLDMHLARFLKEMQEKMAKIGCE